MANENTVKVNRKGEVSIPFFRVGVEEPDLAAMIKAIGGGR